MKKRLKKNVNYFGVQKKTSVLPKAFRGLLPIFPTQNVTKNFSS